jgi:AGZA family xanthine/uracil permease-like MFS transporter
VVKGMGVPWEAALGAVFLSGVAFMILTLIGVRQLIVEAIPGELYSAVAVGIGVFIAMIGMRNAGIIVASPATLVTLGNLRDKNTLLAIFGLVLISALLAWNIRGAMLIGILATTGIGALCGLVKWTPEIYGVSDIAATFGKLDIHAAWNLGFLENYVRVPIRRPVRQRRHAGRSRQKGGTIRRRRSYSAHPSYSFD